MSRQVAGDDVVPFFGSVLYDGVYSGVFSVAYKEGGVLIL